jgi:hypothetical protein
MTKAKLIVSALKEAGWLFVIVAICLTTHAASSIVLKLRDFPHLGHRL